MLARADELGLPVENLLTPELVRRLCFDPPKPADAESVTEYLREAGARTWQVNAALPTLLDGLARAAAGEPAPVPVAPTAPAEPSA